MKKFFLISMICVGINLSLSAQRIKGSDTCLPLSQKAAEVFLKKNPSKKTIISGGGTGVGIAALMSQTTDIAQASRKIKFSERQKIQKQGDKVQETIIAYDALAVVVHPKNKVQKLTREQLEGIFTGKITNWKELGGDDLVIVPYARETSSGTYEFFKEVVLKNKNYKNGIMSLPATGGILQSVSQTPGAIGYVGLAYLSPRVKAISVSFDAGKQYVKPTAQNAKNKSYPIVRPLYYYHLDKNRAKVQSFISFLLSKEGQKIVSEVGFIPVK